MRLQVELQYPKTLKTAMELAELSDSTLYIGPSMGPRLGTIAKNRNPLVTVTVGLVNESSIISCCPMVVGFKRQGPVTTVERRGI